MDPALEARLSALVKELAKKDAEARALKLDLELVESAGSLNLNEDHSSGVRHPITEEDEGKLMKSRNDLKVSAGELSDAKKEKDASSQRLAVAAAHTDMLRAELELMYDAASWRPGDAYGYIDKVKTENEVEGWRRDIDELLKQKEVELHQIGLQSKQMKTLAKQLKLAESVEEEHFNAQTELKILEEQIRSAKDEIASLNRVYKRKEQMLEQLQKKDDTSDLRALEASKRLNAQKMSKHREAMRQNDVMIRNQAVRITKYEDKLELIGEAVRGDDGEEVDRVDVDVLNDVQREISSLKSTTARQGKDLLALDQRVEAADSCMRTLLKQKSVTDKRIEKMTQEHEKNKAKLAKQSKVAQGNADRMIAEQKRRNEDTQREAEESRKKAAQEQEKQRKYEEERAKALEEENQRKEQEREERKAKLAERQKEREERQKQQKQETPKKKKHADPNEGDGEGKKEEAGDSTEVTPWKEEEQADEENNEDLQRAAAEEPKATEEEAEPANEEAEPTDEEQKTEEPKEESAEEPTAVPEEKKEEEQAGTSPNQDEEKAEADSENKDDSVSAPKDDEAADQTNAQSAEEESKKEEKEDTPAE